MNMLSFRRQAAYLFLLFTLLLLLVPRAAHESDMSYWMTWAKDIFRHGLGNAYRSPGNNYNPLYHYILWGYGQLMGSPEKLIYNRYWLKAFTLVFDFAGALWAASLVRERERRFGLALLLLFNIGYLYNTLVWTQVDAIYSVFAFGAVLLGARGRAVGSALCFVLALAAKTQAIIFLPPLLLLWLPVWWHRPRRAALSLGAATLLGLLVLAPFIWGGDKNYLPRIIEINLTAAELYPVVSMNAYNFWYLLQPHGELLHVPDHLLVGPLSYHNWGLLFFCGASALALLPLLLLALRRLRQPAGLGGDVKARGAELPADELARVLLSCGLIPLVFSYFNTQMHERYWHAALLLLAGYGFLRRAYGPYVLVSVAYFLNLEAVLRFLQLRNYKVLVFQPWFVAVLFGLAIGLSLWQLYRLTPWRAEWLRIRGGASRG